MQFLGMKNNVHLCDSCTHDFPTCKIKSDDVIYGTGKGNDNIAACSLHVPVGMHMDLEKLGVVEVVDEEKVRWAEIIMHTFEYGRPPGSLDGNVYGKADAYLKSAKGK